MTNLLKFTDKFIKMLHSVQNSNPEIDSVICILCNNKKASFLLAFIFFVFTHAQKKTVLFISTV